MCFVIKSRDAIFSTTIFLRGDFVSVTISDLTIISNNHKLNSSTFINYFNNNNNNNNYK